MLPLILTKSIGLNEDRQTPSDAALKPQFFGRACGMRGNRLSHVMPPNNLSAE
jgi:hypothetical protein